jgi:hypothetical protein
VGAPGIEVGRTLVDQGSLVIEPRKLVPTALARHKKIAARVWEKQKRGLAHVHGVLSVSTPTEVAWARSYVTALRELAPRYGFAFVDERHKVGRKFWACVQAGAYLSSYFAGGRGRKMAITENVLVG